MPCKTHLTLGAYFLCQLVNGEQPPKRPLSLKAQQNPDPLVACLLDWILIDLRPFFGLGTKPSCRCIGLCYVLMGFGLFSG